MRRGRSVTRGAVRRRPRSCSVEGSRRSRERCHERVSLERVDRSWPVRIARPSCPKPEPREWRGPGRDAHSVLTMRGSHSVRTPRCEAVTGPRVRRNYGIVANQWAQQSQLSSQSSLRHPLRSSTVTFFQYRHSAEHCPSGADAERLELSPPVRDQLVSRAGERKCKN
jgi:hypothetical protein